MYMALLTIADARFKHALYKKLIAIIKASTGNIIEQAMFIGKKYIGRVPNVDAINGEVVI